MRCRGAPRRPEWSTLAAPLLAALIPTALALASLGGCANTPRKPAEPGPAARTQTALQAAQGDMELASAASLARSARLLAGPEMQGKPETAPLSALGSWLFAGLYPELRNPFVGQSSSGDGLTFVLAPAGTRFFELIGPALSLLSAGPVPDEAKALEMLSALGAADQANGNSVLPPYLKALLLERLGRPTETIRPLYEECLRRDPAFYPAKTGIIQSAIDEGTAAAEQQMLLKLAADLPTPVAVQTATARILLAAGQPREAADTAARALLQAPDSHELLFVRAQAFSAMGDWYQSLTLLDAVLKVDPNDSAAFAMKAKLLFEKAGDSDAAMKILSQAEAQFPDDADFPELRGRILLARGNIVGGDAALAAALRLDPTRVSALSLLARSAAGAGRWQEAAGYIERVPQSRRSNELLRLGWQIAIQLQDYDRALALSRELEKRETNDGRLVLPVRTLVEARRSREAQDLASEDLKSVTAPDVRASLYVLRARAIQQAGGDAGAVLSDLREALRENPDDREALISIADVLKASREYRKALTYLKHAQELAPDDASVRARVTDMTRLAESQE